MEGPYRSAGAPTSLECPRCEGVALSRRRIGHVSVDECTRCGGVFVDGKTLGEILEDLGLYEQVRIAFGAVGRAPEGGRFYVKCPACGELMNRRLFAPQSRVIVDLCAAHGTWFDARELPALVAFAEAGGLEKAPPPPEPVIPPPRERVKTLRGAIVEFLLRRR